MFRPQPVVAITIDSDSEASKWHASGVFTLCQRRPRNAISSRITQEASPWRKSGPAESESQRKAGRVFDTEQESEALVVKALLESAGIDSKISGIDTVQNVLPIWRHHHSGARGDEPRPASCFEDYHRFAPPRKRRRNRPLTTPPETAEYDIRSTEDPQLRSNRRTVQIKTGSAIQSVR